MIKTIILQPIFSILFSMVFCSFTKASTEDERPNIVLIVVDDWGWKDAGFMGSTYYETPNIDKLATEGIVCTNGYAGAANCAPSRACLITGRNTPYHGVYTVSPSDRGDKRTRKLIPVKNTNFIVDSVYTLAEAMHDAGYVTGTFGKWHVSEDPCRDGFDINFGGAHWGHPGSYFAPYKKPDVKAPEGEYLPDRVTSEALHFIEQNKNKPFFAYIPYYTVHTPLQGKKELIAKYEEKVPGQGQNHATYAAMIEAMDGNIGRILSRLSELKLDKETLVILTSDNGGICNISSQAPLRAGKGSYYEGGIRVPLIFRWPGTLPANKQHHSPVVNLDFYPTILNIIGQKQMPDDLDGINIMPYLLDHKTTVRDLHWHFPIYLQAYKKGFDESRDALFRTRPGSVIRRGKWKLHYYYEDKGIELYNLQNDPGEQLDLSGQYPEKAEELLLALKRWIKKSGAKEPGELNPHYNPEFDR